jgi:hypothetical protein
MLKLRIVHTVRRCGLVFVNPVDCVEHPIISQVPSEIIVELFRHHVQSKLVISNSYQLTQRQNILVEYLVKQMVQNVEFSPLYAVLALREPNVV